MEAGAGDLAALQRSRGEMKALSRSSEEIQCLQVVNRSVTTTTGVGVDRSPRAQLAGRGHRMWGPQRKSGNNSVIVGRNNIRRYWQLPQASFTASIDDLLWKRPFAY